ncbi:MAG: hypothetical protein GC168_09760 [Candidatus Hydrogenedens sp.]|nr:hypothetical protein [Candidatus Hydrogenedens sp.]
MKHPTREEQRALVQQWKATGEELDRMRREKLRGMPWDPKAVAALLVLGEGQPSRTSSGLEEQQRLFMKWWTKER